MTVAVQDAFGNVVAGDTSTVTITLSSGVFSSGSKTATAPVVNGVAKFSSIAINTVGA